MMGSPTTPGSRSKSRWVLGVATVSIGVVVFLLGVQLEIQNPRTIHEDNIAWCVLAASTALIAAGVSLTFVRPFIVFVVALIAPVIAFALSSLAVWSIMLGYAFLQHRGHQEFAANVIARIEPARQMDRIFADCRHYLTYGENGVPLSNSVAYFGGRYELTMRVPVEIAPDSSGAMIGKPRFYLNELSTVTISPSGQIGASFSRSVEFGSAEWQKVYEADGDFSAIGFNLNPVPVADFQKYTAASRPSN